MFNLGPFELVAIFVVALLVFGPDKLPEIGRQVGKAVKEFKKFQEHMQTTMRDTLEPISGPIQSAMQDNANTVRDALGPIMNNGPIAPTVGAGNPPNVPRSATIQSPQPEGDMPGPTGSFGYYEKPAPVTGEVPDQNGPAPSGEASSAPGSAEPDAG